tara:strand:+ start:932 stop:1573 length:642 start_codon:yes stop_codon:yes gene_type:complete
MNKTINLPNILPIFPLSNFIFFPKTTVPLNIFEKRYLEMINDSMRSDRMIGMIQPKEQNKQKPSLYKIGCAGKITSFNETNDGRYLIVLSGISRFKILEEIQSDRLYRKCKVDFSSFSADQEVYKEKINFSDLKLIFKNLKSLFDKEGYLINWKELEKQDLSETLNALAMASPFSSEEKQILLESKDIIERRKKLEEILNTYVLDNFNNKTVQ